MLPTDDKARKALPILTFLTEYFPDVIVELTKLCVQGNIQHNPELAPTDIKWAREKSTDQMNTAFRHMFDRKRGVHFDSDGQRHIIKSVWRNMAQAQLDIEAARQDALGEAATSGMDDDVKRFTPLPAMKRGDEIVRKGQIWRCFAGEGASTRTRIACKCGWCGEVGDLKRATARTHPFCPDCGADFTPAELPFGWPYAQNGAVDADEVGELTEPERGAGLLPDHAPKPELCSHGLTICRMCEFGYSEST